MLEEKSAICMWIQELYEHVLQKKILVICLFIHVNTIQSSEFSANGNLRQAFIRLSSTSNLLIQISFVIGFPAAAYAAYAAGRGYSGYPSFGLPYPTGNLNLASLHHHLNNNTHNHHHHNNNHNNHHHHHQNSSNSLHPLLAPCHPLVHHPFEHLGVLTHHLNHPMHLWTAFYC